MKYQEIIFKLGKAYYRASAVSGVGVPEKDGARVLEFILSGVVVETGLAALRIIDEAPGLLGFLMTLRFPNELATHRPSVVVESFDPTSQTYEAFVDLDAYFAKEAE